MILLDSKICTNFEEAAGREWLETNGIGGFASGTVAGANSRRYHGLLTAAVKPPLGRITMVSKFEETVNIDGEIFELSSNRYPGSVHPDGYKYLQSFRIYPFPIWRYELGGIEIEKQVIMAHGENTTVIEYAVIENPGRHRPDISLEIKPLLSFTDYHSLQHEDASVDMSFDSVPGLVTVSPLGGTPPLYFHHNASEVSETGHWYRNFQYSIEEERGFDYSEDLFQPFALTFGLRRPASVVISTEMKVPDADTLRRNEITRRRSLIKKAGFREGLAESLTLAADQFIVARGEGNTVIAGYPWFSDWGRDTMIALPGLTLSTNRPEIAKDIILEFSRHLSKGMLPNRFPDAGNEAEYNTVDATLWYFEAVRAYLEATADHAFIRDNIYAHLTDIVAWHLSGTRFNIRVDTDGLLHAGEPGVQLTWMDAKIGDLVVTPRIGKPVEIQALWYNALKIMETLAGEYGDEREANRYSSMADLAEMSFNSVFWDAEEGCLFDVVESGRRDGSVRPNQILAVSMFHPILKGERCRAVVEKVRDELLTPVGLRSLSPNHPDYAGIYEGSPLRRDSSYHQGTVWAWLIGPYIDAHRHIFPEKESDLQPIFEAFENHLREAGVGQISEIFDGDPPHKPRGCFAQAWSVAEVMRVLSNSPNAGSG